MLFEQASVGVAQIDTATGRFVRINRQYCDIVGYSKEEMVRMNFLTITFPEDLAADLAQIERLKVGEITELTLEKRCVHENGHLVWVELTVSPLWAPGNAPDFHLALTSTVRTSST